MGRWDLTRCLRADRRCSAPDEALLGMCRPAGSMCGVKCQHVTAVRPTACTVNLMDLSCMLPPLIEPCSSFQWTHDDTPMGISVSVSSCCGVTQEHKKL